MGQNRRFIYLFIIQTTTILSLQKHKCHISQGSFCVPEGDTQVRFNVLKYMYYQKMLNYLVEIWPKFRFIKIQNKLLLCLENLIRSSLLPWQLLFMHNKLHSNHIIKVILS
jgi:hypothetical protein